MNTATPNSNNRKKETQEDITLTKRDHDILSAVHRYRFVTVADITSLFFAPASRKYAGKLLFRLAGKQDHRPNQYLYRFSLPDTRIGNPEKIYTLGRKGRAYLHRLGTQVHWYYNPSKKYQLAHGYLLHPLTLTKVLIAFKQAVREIPDLTLPTIKTEYELKREMTRLPATVTVKASKDRFRYADIPDAWLDFELLKNRKHKAWKPVWLEIDCDTEEQENLIGQIASRITFVQANGPYKQLFGTNAVTIAYCTTGEQTRLHYLLKWTEELLTKLHKKHKAPLFRFCRLDHGALTGHQLLQEATWYQPFEKRPVTLLS